MAEMDWVEYDRAEGFLEDPELNALATKAQAAMKELTEVFPETSPDTQPVLKAYFQVVQTTLAYFFRQNQKVYAKAIRDIDGQMCKDRKMILQLFEEVQELKRQNGQ